MFDRSAVVDRLLATDVSALYSLVPIHLFIITLVWSVLKWNKRW